MKKENPLLWLLGWYGFPLKAKKVVLVLTILLIMLSAPHVVWLVKKIGVGDTLIYFAFAVVAIVVGLWIGRNQHRV